MSFRLPTSRSSIIRVEISISRREPDVVALLVSCAGFSRAFFMKFFLIAIAIWLLLNVLYVLIVIPVRRGRLPPPVVRAVAAIRRLINERRRPP
ncbi:hypothetical protein ABIB75_000859 [Bradyrhizobium sp. GM2.2]|uniref:hypothetical protein n=1 Tax=Bradyrhizobium sp. GM2.2 TaxID=3156358 RepID=UPI00339880DC